MESEIKFFVDEELCRRGRRESGGEGREIEIWGEWDALCW